MSRRVDRDRCRRRDHGRPTAGGVPRRVSRHRGQRLRNRSRRGPAGDIPIIRHPGIVSPGGIRIGVGNRGAVAVPAERRRFGRRGRGHRLTRRGFAVASSPRIEHRGGGHAWGRHRPSVPHRPSLHARRGIDRPDAVGRRQIRRPTAPTRTGRRQRFPRGRQRRRGGRIRMAGGQSPCHRMIRIKRRGQLVGGIGAALRGSPGDPGRLGGTDGSRRASIGAEQGACRGVSLALAGRHGGPLRRRRGRSRGRVRGRSRPWGICPGKSDPGPGVGPDHRLGRLQGRTFLSQPRPTPTGRAD